MDASALLQRGARVCRRIHLLLVVVGVGLTCAARADACYPEEQPGRDCPARPVSLPVAAAAPVVEVDESADAASRYPLGGRWFVGRDAARDFGIVRESERTEVSLTGEGLRLTVRF